MTKTEAKAVAVAKPKRMSLKDKWNAFWERNRKSEGN